MQIKVGHMKSLGETGVNIRTQSCKSQTGQDQVSEFGNNVTVCNKVPLVNTVTIKGNARSLESSYDHAQDYHLAFRKRISHIV